MESKNIVIKLSVLAMLATTIIFMTYLSPQSMYVPHALDSSAFVQSIPSKSQLSIVNHTKIVLLTYPHLWGFRFNMGRVGFINAGCEVSNCILTTNHTYVKDYNFDAFLIHGPTQRKGPWILPNRRRDQVFILFSTEPPGNSTVANHWGNFAWTTGFMEYEIAKLLLKCALGKLNFWVVLNFRPYKRLH
jgi:hypothetical protein